MSHREMSLAILSACLQQICIISVVPCEIRFVKQDKERFALAMRLGCEVNEVEGVDALEKKKSSNDE